MNATAQRSAGASVLVALLVASCGGGEHVVASDPEGDVAARAAASQDRLPPTVPAVAGSAAADDAVEALSRDACRHRIATTCVQASLHSEAVCRLARCEPVAGFWVLKIPHERVEEDLRRRGY